LPWGRILPTIAREGSPRVKPYYSYIDYMG
jgi:hypothetical protein